MTRKSHAQPAGRLAVLLGLLAALSGCATFVKHMCEQIGSESTSIIFVHTEPMFATGIFKDGRTFTTPAELILRSDEPTSFTIAKEGYKPVLVRLEPGHNPWIWGNLLPLPLPFVGFFVDAEHGADVTLYPDTVDLVLERIPDGDEASPEAAADTAVSSAVR